MACARARARARAAAEIYRAKDLFRRASFQTGRPAAARRARAHPARVWRARASAGRPKGTLNLDKTPAVRSLGARRSAAASYQWATRTGARANVSMTLGWRWPGAIGQATVAAPRQHEQSERTHTKGNLSQRTCLASRTKFIYKYFFFILICTLVSRSSFILILANGPAA